MWDKTAIKEIFYSGSYPATDDQLIVDITYLVNNKFLNIQREIVTSHQEYFLQVDRITKGDQPIADFDGGGNGHMALKIIAQKYLHNHGSQIALFEREFEGCRPDVITPDRCILIECGNVEPNKIFSYFKNETIQKLIIIPYPDPEEPVFAFTFTPQNELARFLFFKEREELRALQKIFNNAHTKKPSR